MEYDAAMMLTPVGFIVPVALLFLAVLSRRGEHAVVDGNPIYFCAKPYVYTMAVIGFVCLLAPWWGPLIAPRPIHTPPAMPWVTSGVCFFFYIWMSRYRVVLDKDVISCGAFFIRQFRYSDITRVKYYGAVAKGQFMIYASSSRWPMTIYSQINDFGSFLDEMRVRLPKGTKVERLGRLAMYDNSKWPS